MKIKFEELEFQDDAVKSVVKVFEGHEIKSSEFTVQANPQLSLTHNEFGIANQFNYDNNRLLENVQQIQIANNIPISEELNEGFPQFNIDMETGERVIIVTGCINALRSRVSGTLVNMIHALLRVIKYNYCKQCMRSKDVLALQY